jgi:hypothetical protein
MTTTTTEVLALFQAFFDAHILAENQDDDEPPPQKKIKHTAPPKKSEEDQIITPDDAVRLFAAASDYYVKIHLEGDVFNMNGSPTAFAKRTYHWAKTVLKPKYRDNLDIDAIATAIEAL